MLLLYSKHRAEEVNPNNCVDLFFGNQLLFGVRDMPALWFGVEDCVFFLMVQLCMGLPLGHAV